MQAQNYPIRQATRVLVLLCVTSCFFSQALLAVTNPQTQQIKKQVRLNPKTKTAAFIRITSTVSINESAAAQWLTNFLAPNKYYSWTAKRTITDGSGSTHVRTQQWYNGLEVEGADYNIHLKNGQVNTLNGIYFLIPTLNINPSLSADGALSKAIAATPPSATKKTTAVLFDTVKLVILPVSSKDSFTFQLCYKVPLKISVVDCRDIYIDANDGKVILSKTISHETNKTGTAYTRYNGTQSIQTDSTNHHFELTDNTRGATITTQNLLNDDGPEYGAYFSAYAFIDSDNIWNNFNAQEDEVATDIHWGVEKTMDFYKAKYNWTGMGNNNSSIWAYGHLDYHYDNSFFTPYGIFFGDGDSIDFTPLCSIEIVGHEFTHGVTYNTAGLSFDPESGALNEGFSDIFGVSIRAYVYPNKTDWVVGDEVSIDGALNRDLSNPADGGNPDTYLGPNFGSEPHADGMVASHAFYLLSSGGSGTNAYLYNYNVQGIGVEKADAIFWQTLTSYLTPYSGFQETCDLSIQAARDLYGTCSNEVQQTINAWKAVGLTESNSGSLYADFDQGYADYCYLPCQVQFVNNSIGAQNYLWNFGDGTTGTGFEPSHTYLAEGMYSVTLTAYSGCNNQDSSVKVRYGLVTVDDLSPCSTNMPNNGRAPTMQHCSGIINSPRDGGDYYAANCNSMVSVITGGNYVTLTFSDVSLYDDGDVIEVFSGTDTSNLVAIINQNSEFDLEPVVVPSGGFTLVFHSNSTGSSTGFSTQFQCSQELQSSSTGPINFGYSILDPCSHLIELYYYNRNSDDDYSYHGFSWYVNGQLVSTEESDYYQFPSAGIYDVKLVVTDNYGQILSTVEKNISVDSFTSPLPACVPVPDFYIPIQAVQLNTINYYSQTSYSATDLSCIQTELLIGKDYQLRVALEQDPYSEIDASSATAWIDLNNDGVFDENTERLVTSQSNSAVNIGTIRLPVNTVTNRPLRLRIMAAPDYETLTACVETAENPYIDFGVIAKTTTGIDNLSRVNSISLFPNPTGNFLNVQLNNSSEENYHIDIFDLQGSLLSTQNIKTNAITSVTVNMQPYAAGVYLVKVYTDTERYTGKVVKQ